MDLYSRTKSISKLWTSCICALVLSGYSQRYSQTFHLLRKLSWNLQVTSSYCMIAISLELPGNCQVLNNMTTLRLGAQLEVTLWHHRMPFCQSPYAPPPPCSHCCMELANLTFVITIERERKMRSCLGQTRSTNLLSFNPAVHSCVVFFLRI